MLSVAGNIVHIPTYPPFKRMLSDSAIRFWTYFTGKLQTTICMDEQLNTVTIFFTNHIA